MNQEKIKIEPFDYCYLEDVCLIENCSFSDPWSRQLFVEELENTLAHYFVALIDNICVGYIGVQNVFGEGSILNVAVMPKYRHRGIGDALINHVISYAIANNFVFLTLEVRESNIGAVSLYKKNGFISVGMRKNYYIKPTENAIIMTKAFT